MDEALYTTWAPRLVRFCANLLRNAHDAEEVVQDVFTKLLATEDRYALDANPGVLLYRLARNRCIDHRRKHRPEPLAEREPVARTENRDLEDALLALTFEEREVLLLTVQDGLTYRDVAQILGCSVGTVAARKYAAVEELKRRLAP